MFTGNCNLPAAVQRFKRGNMKSTRLKFALSSIAFVIVCPSFAFAQVTVDVSKITCKQFVLHEIARPRLVAIWLSGYYAGKRDLPTINIQALEKNTKEIERFCRKVDNLELPLMQAIEKVLGAGQ
jgi:acid stress chaperone HdeB